MGRKMILREEERCDAIVSIISFLFLLSFLGFYFFLLSMERSEIVVVVVIFKVMIFKVYCPRFVFYASFFFFPLACLPFNDIKYFLERWFAVGISGFECETNMMVFRYVLLPEYVKYSNFFPDWASNS